MLCAGVAKIAKSFSSQTVDFVDVCIPPPPTASKSMEANKWYAYTEISLDILRKQSLLCVSSGVSFSFVLHESIGLCSYGF